MRPVARGEPDWFERRRPKAQTDGIAALKAQLDEFQTFTECRADVKALFLRPLGQALRTKIRLAAKARHLLPPR